MEELIEKENAIFDILKKFLDLGLDFIVIGGYAVSSFKHRFSVDADIVVKSEDLKKFEEITEKNGFEKTSERKLENVYSSRFVRYEKGLISIDFLVDAVAARLTGASFSYNLILNNSIKRKIIGIEKEINAKIPIKELLIAMKIHSGRLTDFRDIAALAKDSDLERIKDFLFIGDLKMLNESLKKLGETIKDKNFANSFKGVFIEKKFDIDLKKVEEISRLRN
ncbi:hypothetical protein HYZ97_03220 [Candidatus Pacearchaeota archaeon]|nr:hypothetical protein [Candidatus Pacearchaeota archaeon]